MNDQKIEKTQKTQKTKDTLLILTLMLTIIIDIMGMGLIFPTLPQLFMGSQGVLDSKISSLGWQEFYYGVALAAWPLGLFFGAPCLGHLSDITGRRKVLLTCLFMTAVTYGLCGIAIDLHSMSLFILGRLISGFFAGSFEISQAVIADISSPEKKARNIGFITLAASLGFTVGPLISSFTTEDNLVPWFSVTTPFWTATILSLLNMLSLFCLLKETYKHVGEFKIDWFACFKSVGFIFADKRVRYLGFVFLILQFGWAMYFGPLVIIMHMEFSYSTMVLGWLFALIGLGCGLGTLILQPLSLKYFSLKWMIFFSMSLTGILLVFAAFSFSAWAAWSVAFLASAIEILAYTGSAALFSNSVLETEQGTVLGGVGSLVSVAWFFSGLLTGPSLFMSSHGPLMISAIFMLVGSLMMMGYGFYSHKS